MMASKVELYRIYICGLHPDIERDYLKFEFDAYGEIYYFHFHADEGYTLISYKNQMDAILAIANGNDKVIKGYTIQVQWARGYPRSRDTRYRDYSPNSVYNESCPSNCTVFCWGLNGNNSKNFLQSTFGPFGIIQDIFTKINRFHTDTAMIQFDRKVDATLAICTIDGIQINGWTVGCTWSDKPISYFLEHGWQSIIGYQVPFQPAALPPAFNSSAASSTAFGTPAASSTLFINPAAAPRTTPNSTLITPTISSTTPNLTLRTPTVSSTTFKTPAESNLTSRSCAISSTTSRTPAISSPISRSPEAGTSGESNTGVGTPVVSEAFYSYSSDLFSLRKHLAKILQDVTQLSTASCLPSASTATSSIRPDNISTSSLSSTSATCIYANDDFDTVFDETGPNNCIVYCKGLSRNTTTKSLKEIFSPFGIVEEINLHVDRSDYALIRFNTKEAATLAICSINNSKINGCSVKCTWSNRPDDHNHIATRDFLGFSEPANTSTQPCPLPFPSASKTPSSLSAFTSALLTKQDKSSESEKTKKRNTDIFCKICMDEELGVVFLPCGHLTSCSKCAKKIYICPLCRTLITNKIRTYLS